MIVSPDAGGVYRAKKFREGLAQKYDVDAGLAMIIKQRARANEVRAAALCGFCCFYCMAGRTDGQTD